MVERSSGPPQVPGYHLGEPVGFGASGALWSARDAGGAAVAVTVVSLGEDAAGTARLRRVSALRAASHPHLARVLEVVGLGPGRCAVVTERLEGPTLAAVVRARGPLAPAEGATLLDALAGALTHLHDRGVVHGDVSPANVLVVPGRGPVLVDLVADVATERGTPDFTAPERVGGGAASTAGDVWSLAALVAWACGAVPEVRSLDGARSLAPDRRPRATELTGSPGWPPPAPVRLPGAPELAGAQLRAHAEIQATVSARGGRHRRRNRSGRLVRTVVPVLAVGVGLAAGLGVAAGLVGEDRGGRAPSAPSGPSATETSRPAELSAGTGAGPGDTGSAISTVPGLVATRDEALAASDTGLLARVTVPGSDAAAADQRLARHLDGARLENFTTEIVALRPRGDTAERAEVEMVARQPEYLIRQSGGEPRTVPATVARCVVLVLEPGPWRVADTRSC